MPLAEEQAVVARIREGDRAAFATLYQWYGDPLYRRILRRLPRPELAEDCLRDTFRTALEKIDQFSYQGRSIFHWLSRIAVNKAMDVHRRTQRDRALSEALEAEPLASPVPAPAPRPDRGLEIDDAARQVQAALSQLNPRYARVLTLRLLEERSRDECAELLGVTKGNLDVILHRACKAFRKVYPP